MTEACLNVDGYNLFSRSRTERRGGGVALFVKDSIPAKVVQEIEVPPELECLWISVRPRRLPRGLSELFFCTVYNPPASRHQDALVQHLLTGTDNIRSHHPEAGLVLLGDLNRLNTSDICGGNRLVQVVDTPTRGQSILDVIITDLQHYYQKPEVISPLGLSDHNMVLWKANNLKSGNRTKTKTVRPMRDSDIRAFGQWICSYDWEEVYAEQTSGQEAFSQGKTCLWKQLRNKINREVKRARKSHYCNRVEKLKKENPGKWYQEIKTILNMQQKELSLHIPGNETADNSFIANYINRQFAEVAQGRPRLDPTQLPAYQPCESPPPEIHPWDVYHILRKLKVGKAPGPDQLSTRILKEFSYELSKPIANILNTSLTEGFVPQEWKDAVVVPLPKTQPPSVEKLRPVSLTSQLAKVAEAFVCKWLLQDITPNLDPQQFGGTGLKGRSTTHYLVSLVDHLSKESDKPGNISTMVMTDFSKAFDRIDHTVAICKLIKLGARTCIIPWICDFMSARRQRVRYSGELSEWETLTCSVPQGTLLGPVIFLAVFDDAVREIPTRVSEWKFVDDLSMAESRHYLQPSVMQEELTKFSQWSEQNFMLLNADKCKVMTFCFMTRPPPPMILTINGKELEIVAVARLLGITRLEHVQKRALRTILKGQYSSYDAALQLTGLKSLKDRREDLCLKFATKLNPDLLPPKVEMAATKIKLPLDGGDKKGATVDISRLSSGRLNPVPDECTHRTSGNY
ncbi:hypothetical protein Bbelb_343910 [Branchiostoma belcheri]|nr:hypothetical protein Bbelb_343910 [Branchiostoma belcheri]